LFAWEQAFGSVVGGNLEDASLLEQWRTVVFTEYLAVYQYGGFGD
jgi:hypothetical protein